MFDARAPFFAVLSLVLFSIAYLGSAAPYFEVHISPNGSASVIGHICPNYTPIVWIQKYYSTELRASAFRFSCEEDTDVLYDPGHWTTPKAQAGKSMSQVLHSCNLPNSVIAGARLEDSLFDLKWSFYCSTLASGWRIASDDCRNVVLGSLMNSNSSASDAFVSLVDTYNSYTHTFMNFNEWILTTCKIKEIICINSTEYCNYECCQDVRVYHSKSIRCNGSDGLIIECHDNFYWTGDYIMCSNDVNPVYHYCRLCHGSSFIQFCEMVYCSSSGHYKCQVCFETHPGTGWPLVPNKTARKCRSPGRVASFKLVVKKDEVAFCFGYHLLCTGTGQHPLTILLYDTNNPMDNYQVQNISSTLVPVCLFNHTFACMISNKHGNETKYVSIRHSIIPIVLHSDTTFTACEMTNVTLPCITQGSMHYIEWYFIETLLTNDTSNYTLLDERGILLISSAHKDNIGSYKCKVWNGLGEFEKSMWLTVESFESCVSVVPLRKHSEHQIRLNF
ncbi:PREDICTED: uncharacterized protein LOC109580713 isoform X2 [Amphimedon queenslandica]|uniref:Ig-like domain-containing protein n=1 Tax=Amphimedon queenslandica TaxID=400682 RepID=A0AAN0IZ71_AMPQE|nr:PREDICTED: uncharacterized protein LOC109580713 isoform X2 [Amphimedon queenslandica]|eukprot:XP_019849751.1 PREDICTED: uncharacterized protein LOC109580713 isoform X2 [Amphimedon queenslandica]